VRQFDFACRFLFAVAVIILGLFSLELVLLAMFGAVRSQAFVGSGFYAAHVFFFFSACRLWQTCLSFREVVPFSLDGTSLVLSALSSRFSWCCCSTVSRKHSTESTEPMDHTVSGVTSNMRLETDLRTRSRDSRALSAQPSR
jgi:hypothetical protein